MNWIYLSPHLDDVVLSCGGMICEQLKAGEHVQVWTICAGDPPDNELTPFARDLHTRWESESDTVSKRREEDRDALKQLGVISTHFDYPDCIYRRFPGTLEPVIKDENDLFRPLDWGEDYLVRHLHQKLQGLVPESAHLVLPLTIGNHVDHQFTRLAGEGVVHHTWYYADYPYVIDPQLDLERFIKPGWQAKHNSIGVECLFSWQQAITAYRSQISTFWASIPAMNSAIHTYWQEGGGAQLWGE